MAGTPPEFLGPDGVLREEFYFSTTVASRFFTGTIDADTVDLQVSIQGASFTSDPDLVFFEGTEFTIPNPSAFPDGLQLLPGANRIELKSIFTNGDASSTSFIEATLETESDLGTLISIPTGIQLERNDQTVTITVEGIVDEDVIGYHFYASTEVGGGSEGYFRINPTLVSTGTTSEVTSELGTLEVDAVIATNQDGSPAADPLFVGLTGNQEDSTGTVLQADFNEVLEIPGEVSQVRTSISVESVSTVTSYSFVHDRFASFDDPENPAIPNGTFNTIPEEDPLYYVVTAVYLLEGVEIETSFSPEVAGGPLVVTANVGSFPTVTRQQIVRDMVSNIIRTQGDINVNVGSVVRDVWVDPFSNEASRVRFILEFLHTSQSFATLLLVDDPNLTGTSIPVGQSQFKRALQQAFFLTSPDAAQQIIDNAFDKLASNYGVTRRPGRRSRGEVVFYVTSRPTSSIFFPIGSIVEGNGIRYRTTSSATIEAGGIGATFDPSTGRYSVRAFIQAEVAGVAGNQAPNQIKTVVNGVPGVFVTNTSRTFGGLSEESNRELAVKAQLAIASVDSGTREGVVNIAQDVPGVEQVNVVDHGHPLMVRDYEEILSKHIGGKVDVWVRGNSDARVTDTFAFSFEIAQNIQFEPLGDLQDLTFRAVDSSLSEDSPIVELLDLPSLGYSFRNVTKGYNFDLTNVTIDSYNVVQLSTADNDPVDLDLTDIVTGSYRYRTSSKYVFTRQPVDSIESFVGAVSGTVSPSAYSLFRLENPLELGFSSSASDYIQVVEPSDTTGLTLPAGDILTVTDEQHVILSGSLEYLNNLGVNPLTIQVYNLDRTVEYVSPFDPSVTTGTTPDYTIEEGDATTPTAVLINPAGSNITSGDTVSVDYQHDENFTVEYNTNSLIGVVQNDIESDRHITADIVTKAAIPVPVDFSCTVVVISGRQISQVNRNVRTNLARFFGSLSLGEPVRQSDIVRVIEATDGVSYVVLPFSKMVKQDGALVLQELVSTDLDAEVFEVEDWSTPLVTAWLLTTPLTSATSNGGGDDASFRGVFADQTELSNLSQTPNANGVPLKGTPWQTFIIGSGGLSIPGYSDTATLQAQQPFATDEQIAAQALSISANRVLVTLPSSDSPLNYDFRTTYTVSGSTGVKDIEVGAVSFLELGNVEISYDEDISLQNRLLGR